MAERNFQIYSGSIIPPPEIICQDMYVTVWAIFCKSRGDSYPIILMLDKVGYVVYIPDFNINTEGDTLTEAIKMARDAIGIVRIDKEDDGESLPEPTAVSEVKADSEADIVTLVDVDFGEYRRKNDMRAVKNELKIQSR